VNVIAPATRKPRVSVIIPTFNRATLLRRAIGSALCQTVSDVELVVADDASTDHTAETVRSFHDQRIVFLRHSVNQGVAAARNTAIANARGEYVAFLDDDDEWLPDKLRLQLRQFEGADAGVALVCSGNYEVDTATNRILAEITPALRGQVFDQLLTRGSFNRTSTVVVRARCLEAVGPFDPALKYGEDFDLWLRLARHYDFDFVTAPLVKVYLQPDGLTQNYEAIISGAEVLFRKHRALFEQHPRSYSRGLHRLGTYYCFNGNVKKGRELFLSACAKDWLATRSYACAALSLLGPRAFKHGYAVRERLLRALQREPDILRG